MKVYELVNWSNRHEHFVGLFASRNDAEKAFRICKKSGQLYGKLEPLMPLLDQHYFIIHEIMLGVIHDGTYETKFIDQEAAPDGELVALDKAGRAVAPTAKAAEDSAV